MPTDVEAHPQLDWLKTTISELFIKAQQQIATASSWDYYHAHQHDAHYVVNQIQWIVKNIKAEHVNAVNKTRGTLAVLFRDVNVSALTKQQLSKTLNQILFDWQTDLDNLSKSSINQVYQYCQTNFTYPANINKYATQHILLQVQFKLHQIMQGLKLIYLDHLPVVDSPNFTWPQQTCGEIDTIKNNFDDLNVAAKHPSRAATDTFYLEQNPATQQLLLRTHCTNLSFTSLAYHCLKDEFASNFGYYTIGKVYRSDDHDVTHFSQFNQLDLVVKLPKMNFFIIKALIVQILTLFFEQPINIRFRSSYFPFTSPSFEVDMQCIFCQINLNQKQLGCTQCKNTKWIEILGCGLIHPKVIINAGFSSNPFQQQIFALGLGVERLAMLKYQVADIRAFYQNNYQFLRQF